MTWARIQAGGSCWSGVGAVQVQSRTDRWAASSVLTPLTDEPERFERALASLEGGFDIGDAVSYADRPLVIDRVD